MTLVLSADIIAVTVVFAVMCAYFGREMSQSFAGFLIGKLYHVEYVMVALCEPPSYELKVYRFSSVSFGTFKKEGPMVPHETGEGLTLYYATKINWADRVIHLSHIPERELSLPAVFSQIEGVKKARDNHEKLAKFYLQHHGADFEKALEWAVPIVAEDIKNVSNVLFGVSPLKSEEPIEQVEETVEEPVEESE